MRSLASESGANSRRSLARGWTRIGAPVPFTQQRYQPSPRGNAYDPGSGIRQTPLLPFTTPLALPIILLMTQYRLSSRGGSRVAAARACAGGSTMTDGDEGVQSDAERTDSPGAT